MEDNYLYIIINIINEQDVLNLNVEISKGLIDRPQIWDTLYI